MGASTPYAPLDADMTCSPQGPKGEPGSRGQDGAQVRGPPSNGGCAGVKVGPCLPPLPVLLLSVFQGEPGPKGEPGDKGTWVSDGRYGDRGGMWVPKCSHGVSLGPRQQHGGPKL